MSVDERELIKEKFCIIDKSMTLNKIIALNLMLYEEIKEYAKRNNILLPYNLTIARLIKEIEELSLPTNLDHRKLSSDGFLQGDESDDNFTEP